MVSGVWKRAIWEQYGNFRVAGAEKPNLGCVIPASHDFSKGEAQCDLPGRPRGGVSGGSKLFFALIYQCDIIGFAF